mmetsp:Transcript_17321/g.27961  ORF Transcript_17321/g.27961 Transcript_17321/m.27961 type:complete len:85 (-) Transcript_17321:132-386(-)
MTCCMTCAGSNRRALVSSKNGDIIDSFVTLVPFNVMQQHLKHLKLSECLRNGDLWGLGKHIHLQLGHLDSHELRPGRMLCGDRA